MKTISILFRVSPDLLHWKNSERNEEAGQGEDWEVNIQSGNQPFVLKAPGNILKYELPDLHF